MRNILPAILSDLVPDLLSTEVLSLAGTIVIAVLLVLSVKLRETLMAWVGQAWDKLKGKHGPITIRDITRDRGVHELLVELRVKVSADRTRVFQFHNGQAFGNRNPLWRISCTHESCKAGISHELPNSQNIFASSIWELLEPIFSKKSLPGVQFIDDKNSSTHDLFVVDVKNMPEGYCKSLMISQGVYSMSISPLHYHGQVFGFLTICSDQADEPLRDIELTRHFAANISFILKRN